jgi:hypothetical protein
MSTESEAFGHFRRSSFCGEAGCVEVAAQPTGDILVRDAKDHTPDAPVLRFSQEEWTAFVAGVQAGEFSPDTLLGQS